MMKRISIFTVLLALFCAAAWAGTLQDVIPKTSWKLVYADSEEPSSWRAAYAIDGKTNTFWHTKWIAGSTGYPHEIRIDIGKPYPIDGFRYLPRQDGGLNGTIKKYEFYVSEDGVDWGSAVAAGTFDIGTSEKEILFAPKTGRFVRLRALSEINGNPWASMAEIDLLVEASPVAAMVPDWTSVRNPPFPSAQLSQVLTARDITDISATFIADPFLFYENGEWYMFFEILPVSGYTKFGLARSKDGINWKYERIVFGEQFQISYPQVFKYGDKYYMIPETGPINEVRIYEAQNFPYDWHYSSTIISGRSYVDPSIFRYNGKWWLFASENATNNCYLFYSQNLTSGWTQHPMSPIICNDASKSRQGGRAFVYDGGRIIRIVQKDDIYYGEKVRAFEVDRLTETEYTEHEVSESPILNKSGTGWNAVGMHTFDPWWTGNHWICAVDGIGYSNAWSIGIAVVPHPSAPESVITSPSSNVPINVGQWVRFSGTESYSGGNYPLSYLWQFGAGSGIADSGLKEPGFLQFSNPGTYTVSFKVTDSSGIYDPTPETRVIVVGANSSTIPKTGWKVFYADSEERVAGDFRAAYALDGKTNTFWHTQWGTGAGYPHEIQIDLGKTYQINGFRYLPRQDGGKNGTVGQYEFYVSEDGVRWGSSVAAGTFGSGTSVKEVLLAPKAGHFVRFRALSEVNGNPWTSMAEFDVLGSVPPESVIDTPSATVSINTGQSIRFSGRGTDGNYPYTYQWQFGAGSGIADSTLENPGVVQFNNPGIYTVSYTVTDCTGTPDPTPATRVIVVGMNTAPIPKAGWQVVYADSEETMGAYWLAKNAIDGKANTFWHTKWVGGSPGYPHEIQIDLGKTYQINGFRYLPRQDGSVNGTVKRYEFYVSEDGVSWGSSVAVGVFETGASVKEVLFAPKAGRFVHLRALSEVNGNPWTSMAEIDVLGF